MAIPPPHAFINVAAARMTGPTVLELAFDHPACPDPALLFAEVFWEETGPTVDEGAFVLGLFERREHHGQPTCTGPAVAQRRQWALPDLLPDPRIRRGRLHLNSERLYGRHQRLPAFVLDFDFGRAPGAEEAR